MVLALLDEGVADREAAFREAVQAFARHQGMPLSNLPIPDLSGPEYRSVLHVHMTALDLVGSPEDPGRDPAAVGSPSVLRAALLREQRYWRRSARRAGLAHPDRVLARTVLVATLIGADDEDQAAELLCRVPDLEDASQEVRRMLARWEHELYGDGGWLGALRPGALAEALVAEVLGPRGEAPPALVNRLCSGLPSARTRRALTVLDRAVQRQPELETVVRQVLAADLRELLLPAVSVAVQTGDPIGRLVAEVVAEAVARGDGDSALLDRLAGAIPEETVALRELAAMEARHRVEVGRRGSADDLARALQDLGLRLRQQGDREGALKAVEEAVGIRRRLARGSPAQLPALAGSLYNLGIVLGELGRREAALGAVEEAVGIYRGLAGERSGAHLPELAMAMTTWASGSPSWAAGKRRLRPPGRR